MERKRLLTFLAILIIGGLPSCMLPDEAPVATHEAPVATYTVTYNGNSNTRGSVPIDTTKYTEGTSVSVLDNSGSLMLIPAAGSAEAFKFGGWNTEADGSGTDYGTSSTFNMASADITLYAKWISFSLRDTGPAGGYVFYDKGSFTNGWRYLEAAAADQSGIFTQWSNITDKLVEENPLSQAVGAGKTNTDAIVAQSVNTIAQICLDYSIDNNGTTYADWFLPSLDELNLMYTNLWVQSVGDFAADYYWSSSDDNDNADNEGINNIYEAWRELFTNGHQDSLDKNGKYTYVRAARLF